MRSPCLQLLERDQTENLLIRPFALAVETKGGNRHGSWHHLASPFSQSRGAKVAAALFKLSSGGLLPVDHGSLAPSL